MRCPVCGGARERTGKLLDISKITGYSIHRVSVYICLDCGKKSLSNGDDIEHWKGTEKPND